ncbi:hypothetical protein ACIP5Y_02835 [Nocardia sp. NPDC088792]|uniref:SCO6745 family protein n=1 Tax=Nocardia sp. NPDC088792 TaxID=3364332 RepID=UPI0037FA3E32
MNESFARDIWRVLEPLHAVTYFAPECLGAFKAAGLRGFWMGYFAGRSAPFGAAGPNLVEAAFFNFHPRMVRRAIPDAWGFATPEAVLAARSRAAAEALRGMAPGIDAAAEQALPSLRAAVAAAPAVGRPLFAANRDLPALEDPVESLWQAVTALREHRGDGHIGCLLAAGLDGGEALALFAADTGTPPELWRELRGWSEDEWAAAESRLAERGLLDGSGITEAGRALRSHIESRTDALALTAYTDVPDIEATLAALTPAARAVAGTGVVRSPDLLHTGAP